jgi:glyoxylase-like metal-dependent hydrolase (beta-lactamase superfamily II)
MREEPSNVEQITDSIHHLPDVTGGPTILLGESVVVIDTGLPGDDAAILVALSELGRSPSDVSDIVITHADRDHVGGLAALSAATGATVWAGTYEADVIEGKRPARSGDVSVTGQVDRRFEPWETLPLAGGLVVVDTRGHTAGHVALFLTAERILFTGDCVFNRDGSLTGSPPQNTADAEQARDAVRTIAELKPDTLVFGHGPSIIGGAAEQLEALDASLG